MLLTRLFIFACFWWVKISLKREALVKYHILVNLAASQNKPKTRSSRQKLKIRVIIAPRKQRYNAKLSSKFDILSIFDAVKRGLKHDTFVKTCIFQWFFEGPKCSETRNSCRKTHISGAKYDAVDEIIAFSMFLMGQNQPETRSSCQISHFGQFGRLAK